MSSLRYVTPLAVAVLSVVAGCSATEDGGSETSESEQKVRPVDADFATVVLHAPPNEGWRFVMNGTALERDTPVAVRVRNMGTAGDLSAVIALPPDCSQYSECANRAGVLVVWRYEPGQTHDVTLTNVHLDGAASQALVRAIPGLYKVDEKGEEPEAQIVDSARVIYADVTLTTDPSRSVYPIASGQHAFRLIYGIGDGAVTRQLNFDSSNGPVHVDLGQLPALPHVAIDWEPAELPDTSAVPARPEVGFNGNWRSFSLDALRYTPDIEGRSIVFRNGWEGPKSLSVPAAESTVVRMRRIDVEDVSIDGASTAIRGVYRVTRIGGGGSSYAPTHTGLWVLPGQYRVDIEYTDHVGYVRTQEHELDLR